MLNLHARAAALQMVHAVVVFPGSSETERVLSCAPAPAPAPAPSPRHLPAPHTLLSARHCPATLLECQLTIDPFCAG